MLKVFLPVNREKGVHSSGARIKEKGQRIKVKGFLPSLMKLHLFYRNTAP